METMLRKCDFYTISEKGYVWKKKKRTLKFLLFYPPAKPKYLTYLNNSY